MSLLTENGATLRANGFTILPLSPGAKYPVEFNWQGCDQTDEAIATWDKIGFTGVGINTHNLAAIDIDVLEPALVTAMTQMINQVAPGGLVRIGQPPKRVILFRVAESIKKKATPFYLGKGTKNRVECLGDGQQICAFHIHPDTHEEYTWLTNSPLQVPWGDLSEITSESLTEILKRCQRMMEKKGWRKQGTATNNADLGKDPGSALANMKMPRSLAPGEAESVLRAIPIHYLDNYDTWIKTGMALHHQYKGDPSGLALWDEFSARSDHYQVGCCNPHWASFGREAHEMSVTFGTLIEWAKEAAPVDAPTGNLAIPAPEFRLIKVPRPPMFIAPGFGPGTMTMVYGKPGIGKSYLIMDLLRALHTGTSWMGFPIDLVTYPKSLLVDGELPKDLIDDRLDDVFETLPGDLFIISKQHYLNTHESGDFNLANPLCREMIDEVIRRNHINVLVLDNKVSLVTGVEENSLAENSAIVQWLIRVRARGVMVNLVHHANKSGSQRGTTAYEDPMDNILRFSGAPGASELTRQVFFEKTRRGRPNNCDETLGLTMTEYGTRPVTFEVVEVKMDEYDSILKDVQHDPGGTLRARGIRLELSKTTLERKLLQGVADKHLQKRKGKYRLTSYGEAYLVEGKGDEFDDLLQ